MATIKIADENKSIKEFEEIKNYLSGFGINYERWTPSRSVPPDPLPEEILEAYAEEIERLKAQGGYITADVINVNRETQGLEEMLAKFNREHWHDEDEVRFIIRGRGLFHIRARTGEVFEIEVEAGDLICVPRGTWHWFNLCEDREIRAIRLFQDSQGWTPHYTDSGVDRKYEPVCFGASYIPAQSV